MNIIPPKWIPTIKFSGFEFEPMYNNDEVAHSGFRIQTSIFAIGCSSVVYVVEVCALLLIFLIVWVLTKAICNRWNKGKLIRKGIV